MKPHLLPALLLNLAATPLLAMAMPEGINEQTWAAIERQIEAEVDRDLAAGKAEFERGAFGSEHGMARTAVLTGDYNDLATQDGSDGPRFGHSVAIDGDWLAVGAPGTIWTHATHGTADHGAVFVFRRAASGWALVQRLLSTNTPAGGRCGHAIALRPPYLAVGCPNVDNTPGTQINGWVRIWRLNQAGTLFFNFTSHPGFSNGRCGSALAISQDYVAVGCPTIATNDEGGRVRIYRRDQDTGTFALEATLSPPNAMVNARFGDSVALNQSPGMPPRLAAGAPLRSPSPFISSGGVHVFERSGGDTPGWTQSAFVTAPTQASFAFFGLSVDLIRSSLLVGAPNDFCPSGSQRCGRVYRYSRSGSNWNFAEAGHPTNVPGGAVQGPEPGMSFGAAVAFGFDFHLAVAAPNADGTHAPTSATASDVGLVELRRPASGNNYNANSYRGVVRPPPLGQTTLAEGKFGTSIDFSVGVQRLAVGYPGVGSSLPAPGVRRGQVWIYETDLIFADGFESAKPGSE